MSVKQNRPALILLHEIYGVNRFIHDLSEKYSDRGLDVFCPNLLQRPPFAYEEAAQAYGFFMQNEGLDKYIEINAFASELRKRYDKLLLMGFSAGATIAWRCSDALLYSGIIVCYGSRIRDYLNVTPACPTLLLFAREDSFDVSNVVSRVQAKKHITVRTFGAAHGFLNPDCTQYNRRQAKNAENEITHFIDQCIK